MLPIPTHLKNTLIPIGDKNGESHVDGVIRCTCGFESFYIKIYADTKNGYLQAGEYNSGYALVVKAECKDCGKTHLIFDGSKHGWNGFVCHDGVTVPDVDLKSWNCPKCNCDIHNIKIGVNSQGKQDFIDETGIADGESDFTEDEWVDAFDWITMGLKCSGCGHTDEKWIDYETM